MLQDLHLVASWTILLVICVGASPPGHPRRARRHPNSHPNSLARDKLAILGLPNNRPRRIVVCPWRLHTGAAYLYLRLGQPQANSEHHGRPGNCDAGDWICRSSHNSTAEQKPTLPFRMCCATHSDVVCRGLVLRCHESRPAQGLSSLGHVYRRSLGTRLYQCRCVRTLGCSFVPPHSQDQGLRQRSSNSIDVPRAIPFTQNWVFFAPYGR